MSSKNLIICLVIFLVVLVVGGYALNHESDELQQCITSTMMTSSREITRAEAKDTCKVMISIIE